MTNCKNCVLFMTCRYHHFNGFQCPQFKHYEDVVEVVRCKDCKHWSESQYGCECSFHSKKENEDYPAFAVEMCPDDFCSYGERKDNAQKKFHLKKEVT